MNTESKETEPELIWRGRCFSRTTIETDADGNEKQVTHIEIDSHNELDDVQPNLEKVKA